MSIAEGNNMINGRKKSLPKGKRELGKRNKSMIKEKNGTKEKKSLAG